MPTSNHELFLPKSFVANVIFEKTTYSAVMHGAEESWPPSTTMSPGFVAREIIMRLKEGFHIEGIRRTGAILTEGGWVAEVGLWPDSNEKVEAVRRALAPMEVKTFPHASVPRRC
jgi:hypothetical protein